MRNSNYTNFDIYSVFKYDDAKKYFERYIFIIIAIFIILNFNLLK